MATLLKGSIFEISDDGPVVWCRIEARPEITPTEGAQAAETIASFLIQRVMNASSEYRALVFDVREGPAVFGPTTRAALELIFRAGEQHRKRIAALVSTTAIQQLQFTALVRENASHAAIVTVSPEQARAWTERTES